jgi:Xaa-Pro dipeptidase
MASHTRREFIRAATTGTIAAAAASALAAPARAAGANPPLRPITASAQPIPREERQARLGKLQELLQRRGDAAFLAEAGTSLEYYTGVKWWRSERTTAALVPARGRPVVVTPYFEEPSIRETLQVDADVRTWKEDQSPFVLLADAMRSLPDSSGRLAVEHTTRFFIWDRLARELGAAAQLVSGEELVRACRMHKSPAEIALMQVANEVTMAAIRHVHGRIERGMTADHIMEMLVAATTALGAEHDFSLVLLNEASALPHGSVKPQSVRAGSTILVDSTCIVHGYQSDISRTWVHGEPSKRQREIWQTVKRGQELALETAKPGVPVGAVDRAVRAWYESLGWNRDYQLPGLSHRTGHGIGMDGHEPPYLVRSDDTPLETGMCFSDEPGLYIPGEFGVRLEDCWHMTDAGPKLFTPLAKSIDAPV